MVWEMAMKRKKERVVVMVRARGLVFGIYSEHIGLGSE